MNDTLSEHEFLRPNIYRPLCEFCEYEQELTMDMPMEKKRHLFLKCSNVPWVCRARLQMTKPLRVIWNPYQLMTQKKYSEIVNNIVHRIEPITAVYSLKEFNQELVKDQMHMQKICHIGELLTYMGYSPLKLEKNIFPLPELGKEFYDGPVFPEDPSLQDVSQPTFTLNGNKKEKEDDDDVIFTWIQDCDCADPVMNLAEESCTKCNKKFKKECCKMKREPEKTDEDVEMIDNENWAKAKVQKSNWGSFFDMLAEDNGIVVRSKTSSLEKNIDLARAKKLMTSKYRNLLQTIDVISGCPDPCSFCQHCKKTRSDCKISCTGHLELCEFKDMFFNQWPAGLERPALINKAIIECSNKNAYRELLNKIFSMYYIERCIQVKFLIDNDIAILHPQMIPYISVYDALILRYVVPNLFETDEVYSDDDNHHDDGEGVDMM